MKYTQKSFSSAPATDAYRENYDRIFRGAKPRSDVDAAEFDVLQRIDEAHQVACGFPDVPEGLEDRIKELHKSGDRQWEHGYKGAAGSAHDEAFRLGEPYGLNPQPCKKCGCYMKARLLAAHALTCS